MGKIRVAIVADMPLLRDGITHVLTAAEGFVVLTYGRLLANEGQASARSAVDVLIVEVDAPEGSFQLVEKLAVLHPNTGILVLGATGDPHTVVTALKGGVRGYALKSVSSHDLIEAVRQLALGESYVAPSLAAALLGGSIYFPNIDVPAPDAFSTLTPREADILPHLSRGRSNKEIAGMLGLSEKTIKYHLTHMLRKLGARNRVEVALIASSRARPEPASDPASLQKGL